MPKRSRKATPAKKRAAPKRDANQTAFDALQRVLDLTGETGGKNPLAVALGRLGGLKGGHARAATMTPEQRSKSAAKAAQARWKKS
jgi:hypothetical protein